MSVILVGYTVLAIFALLTVAQIGAMRAGAFAEDKARPSRRGEERRERDRNTEAHCGSIRQSPVRPGVPNRCLTERELDDLGGVSGASRRAAEGEQHRLVPPHRSSKGAKEKKNVRKAAFSRPAGDGVVFHDALLFLLVLATLTAMDLFVWWMGYEMPTPPPFTNRWSFPLAL